MSDATGLLLAPPPPASGTPPPAKGRLSGQRVGSWRLIAEIGRGGMGEVYRAARADEEYQQDVAIKLVHGGGDPAFVAARLRAERQILARLEHPNIARLLDGGTTDAGVPYLVMQLIDGEPIDVYCESQRLDTAARLALFLQVCSAVQYAHQHMVIHRDLKPTNILVAEGGVPKLLDFGIAKVAEPGASQANADHTIKAHRILTPHYASPEQFQGEVVTAASDVYSLGVVLYELLTGIKPWRWDHTTDTREIDNVLSNRRPLKPSIAVLGRSRPAAEGSLEKLSRRLKGDLDNIVLMALRTEPERRYATVAQFADDIRRHLARLPVAARKDTLAYRSARFLRRHAVAVGTSGIVAAALITGMVVAMREAHIAQEQRAKAEQRFNDVRALSNALIFDVHDSIRDLSGAAGSRRLLVKTALKYLESLSQESQGDPALQRELAAAFVRLGDLQGQAFEANESDFEGAQKSYRRAYALLESSLALDGANERARRDIVTNAGKLSDLLWYTGDPDGALSFSEQTFVHARALLAAQPNNPSYRTLLAICEGDYAYKLFEIRGDTAKALPYLQGSIEQLEAAKSQPRIPRTLALTYMRAEEMYEVRGEDNKALAMAENARRLLAQMTAAAPDNADLLHLKAFADHDAASALIAERRLPEAREYEQAALDGFRRLVARDANVDEYRMDVSQSLNAMARISIAEGKADDAFSLLAPLAAETEESRGMKAGGLDFQLTRARTRWVLADAYSLRAGEPTREPSLRERDQQLACEAYESAVAQFAPLSRQRIEAARATQQIRALMESCSKNRS